MVVAPSSFILSMKRGSCVRDQKFFRKFAFLIHRLYRIAIERLRLRDNGFRFAWNRTQIELIEKTSYYTSFSLVSLAMPRITAISAVFHLVASIVSFHLSAVDFETEVAPILEAKCLSCHNPNILKGDFSMTTRANIMAAGEDILIPGNADDSVLHWITLPLGPDEPAEMPEKGEPLTEAEAAKLGAWIDEGAQWSEAIVLKEASKADKSWWAYQPIEESELSSVDAFVEETLEEVGLALNSEADRRVLIRRATYDLIGLPPTAEEVEAFVEDTDPNAYEALVDRLLSSPHYGERWGRHWLDVVRFGESVGFEQNWLVEDLWPFRDYVIRSINEDKPFDALVREHLAGDVIGAGDPNVEIGSAFLVAGPYDTVGNQDAAQAAQIRANTLDEMINTSSGAFLGMTLSCARCHDHKFDPISQADYHRAYATFSGVRHGSVPWAKAQSKRERSEALKPLNRKRSDLEAGIETLDAEILKRGLENLPEYQAIWTRPPVDRRGVEETFDSVSAKYVRLICEAQDLNPRSNTGFRIEEFEVWSDAETPQNVALSVNGGIARGPARINEDFPNVYGPQHTIDGRVDQRFIATSDHLIIELAKATPINRVLFSSARLEQAPDLFKFAFVADYRIEVSIDGEKWQEVAHGRDRRPVAVKPLNPARNSENTNPSHLHHRLARIVATAEENARKQVWKKELAQLKKEIGRVPVLPTAWIGKRNETDAEGPFHVFIGGSPRRPGDTVVLGSLSTLSEALEGYELGEDTPEAERRLKFAQWITHPDNPLTPRVLANRLWHYHFGIGIVDTPNDFGYMGSLPTHPELLDFLADQLKKNDWRIKPMHRMIMTSKAYRQSSDWNRASAKVDAASRFLWRFPPRRLSAEEIRDTILHVTKNLDTKMGGPGFRLYHYMRDNVSTYEALDEHGPETYRRAVYHQNARASVVDLMTEFDQADCTLSTPKRSRTTTPLQALTLMNHQFTLDMADGLAENARSTAGDDLAAQIDAVYRLAYQRSPERAELRKSIELAEQHGLRALCRAILNSSELIYLD